MNLKKSKLASIWIHLFDFLHQDAKLNSAYNSSCSIGRFRFGQICSLLLDEKTTPKSKKHQKLNTCTEKKYNNQMTEYLRCCGSVKSESGWYEKNCFIEIQVS